MVGVFLDLEEIFREPVVLYYGTSYKVYVGSGNVVLNNSND
jgi:hypothetical protein